MVLGVCLGLLGINAVLAAGPPGRQLRLKVGSFDPASARAAIPDRLRLASEPESGHFVVQFRAGFANQLQRLVDFLLRYIQRGQ